MSKVHLLVSLNLNDYVIKKRCRGCGRRRGTQGDLVGGGSFASVPKFAVWFACEMFTDRPRLIRRRLSFGRATRRNDVIESSHSPAYCTPLPSDTMH